MNEVQKQTETVLGTGKTSRVTDAAQGTGLPISLSCRREISLSSHSSSAFSLSKNNCRPTTRGYVSKHKDKRHICTMDCYETIQLFSLILLECTKSLWLRRNHSRIKKNILSDNKKLKSSITMTKRKQHKSVWFWFLQWKFSHLRNNNHTIFSLKNWFEQSIKYTDI